VLAWVLGCIVVVAVLGGAYLASTEDDVPWDDYSASVKTELDGMADSGDCTGLQQQFDTADANNDATMARTGHNNAALMGYIDDLMSDAGCYG
jgi:hypothetical protein